MKTKKWPRNLALTMAAIALVIAVTHKPAHSAVLGDFATEHTQIFNHIELVTQVLNQLEQIANQLDMLENMYINTLDVPYKVWGRIKANLQQLHRIVRKGRAIAYTMQNLDEEFKRRFKGYKAEIDYYTEFESWSVTSLDAMRGALDAANIQADQMDEENGFLELITALSESAEGRMEAIQAGNQIANMQVQQIQKLRQLTMAQIQAQTNYQAAQQQRQASDAAMTEEVMQYKRQLSPASEGNLNIFRGLAPSGNTPTRAPR